MVHRQVDLRGITPIHALVGHIFETNFALAVTSDMFEAHLDLRFHVVNRVAGLDLQRYGFPSQSLDENLHVYQDIYE